MMHHIPRTNIPAVDHLIDVVHLLQFKIRRSPKSDLLEGYTRIEILTLQDSYTCIVDDEYHDLCKNPYAALQVILLSAMDLEDLQGELMQVLANHPKERHALQRFWHDYKATVAHAEVCVAPLDWQINAHTAQILRGLGKKSSKSMDEDNH